MEEPMWKVSGKMPPNHRKAHQPDRLWFSVWQASCKRVSWFLVRREAQQSSTEDFGSSPHSSVIGGSRYSSLSASVCFSSKQDDTRAPLLGNVGGESTSVAQPVPAEQGQRWMRATRQPPKSPLSFSSGGPPLQTASFRLLPLYLPCSLHFDFFTLCREKRSSFGYTNIFLNYSGSAVILSKVIEEQRSFVKDTEHRAGRAHRLKRGTHQRLPGIRGTFK